VLVLRARGAVDIFPNECVPKYQPGASKYYQIPNHATSASDLVNSLTFAETASTTLGGVLLGAGAEYALGRGWTAKLDYNFIKFETKDLNFAGTLQATGNGSLGYTWRQSVSADVQIVKVGVNYLFNF
jgi:opacity protein-like surface antigen